MWHFRCGIPFRYFVVDLSAVVFLFSYCSVVLHFATSLWNFLAVHLLRYFLVVFLCGSAVVLLLCGISVPVSLSLQLLCFSAVHLVWYFSVIIRGGIFC